MIIVSDTSPLSGLIIIGQLSLLRELYGQVVVPMAVHEELSNLSDFGIDLSGYLASSWIRSKKITDQALYQRLCSHLDAGEAAAITLAKELSADHLIIDERKGRKVAQAEGIQTIGLIGVILEAKAKQLIPLAKPVIDRLRAEAGFYLKEPFYQRVLRSIGE